MIRIRISHPRSLGSWCIKATDESTLDKDPSVLLMHHDPSDVGPLILIWIIPKEHTLIRNKIHENGRRECNRFRLRSINRVLRCFDTVFLGPYLTFLIGS